MILMKNADVKIFFDKSNNICNILQLQEVLFGGRSLQIRVVYIYLKSCTVSYCILICGSRGERYEEIVLPKSCCIWVRPMFVIVDLLRYKFSKFLCWDICCLRYNLYVSSTRKKVFCYL